MAETVVALASCLGLALVVGWLALPIVAIVRTHRIRELTDHLRALEREIGKLRRRLDAVEAAPRAAAETPLEAAVVAPAEAAATPAEAFVVADAPVDAKAVPPRERERTRPEPKRAAIDWEAWLGARGLGWTAVVLLLFAVAFFLAELFENDIIGPVGRIAIGIGIGLLAAIAGYRQHVKGWRITSQMLTSAGVVVVYLSTFASFRVYELLEPNAGGIFLMIVVAEAFALAVVYDAPAIAVMAVVGGLLNPVLLRSDHDRYIGLFLYLTILNAGVVGLLLARPWRYLSLLAIVGTQLLFWGWFDANYHPQKLRACLVFQLAIASLWFLHQLYGPMKRFATLGIEGAIRLFVEAMLLAVAGYVLLFDEIPNWMGTLCVAMAIVHTGLTWMAIERRPADPLHAICEWTLAMSFVAAALFVQSTEPWVAICWAAQGLALWWFGLRARILFLRGMALVLFAMAIVRFVFVQVFAHEMTPGPITPIFNPFALAGLGIAASLLIASVVVRQEGFSERSPDFLAGRIVGLTGLFLVWVVLSVETYTYFDSRQVFDATTLIQRDPSYANRNPEDLESIMFERNDRLQRMGQTALSIVWGAYAIVLLTLGLKLPSWPLRWSALGLFGITLIKVIFIDMERLPGLYRVSAFLGLSLMLGAAAWAYQRVKISLSSEEEAVHDSPK